MAAIALLAAFLGANVTSISAVVRLDFLSFKDAALIDALLQAMAATSADFTNTFRALSAAAEGANDRVLAELGNTSAGNDWLDRWRTRVVPNTATPSARAAGMRRMNPAVTLRNHRVEAALAAAVANDFEPFESLLQVIATPWHDDPDGEPYRRLPAPEEVVQQTVCGT